MTIRDWPVDERPREKLLLRGAAALSDAELLAILLRTGTAGRSAVDVAREVLARFQSLRKLLSADRSDFCAVRGLSSARYAELQAAMEIARRQMSEVLKANPLLASAAATREYLAPCQSINCSRPSTIDRIRSQWLGAPISRYAEWLSARQQSRASALYKIQTVTLFNEFVTDRHVRALEDLPAQIEPFIGAWKRTRGRRPHTASYGRQLRTGPRMAIEELLRLVLPGFVGTERRQPWPLQDLAPGFLEHFRDERGLRPDALHGYERHLRVFERFLRSEEITDLSTLTRRL